MSTTVSTMRTSWVVHGIGDAERARLEEYWAKKLPRLEKLLTPYPKDIQELRLTVSHHQPSSQRSWYEVRAVLHLPTGTLAAEANDKDPQAALDRLADTLVAEVKRHKELVRRDYLHRRKTRNRADLSAAGPLLRRHAEEGRREDLLSLLRPHLGFLRNLARRELRSLELAGLLHRGEVTVDDVLNEILARAARQFADRAQRLPLDLWLTGLLQETAEQWVKQEPRGHASLEQRVKDAWPDEVPEQDEEWWAPLMGEEEILRLEDVIPDEKATSAWEQLEETEQTDRLLSLMRDLPPARRQVFLLHALDDSNTAEIAMIQDRPEAQVKADIEAARRTLRDRLLAAGFVQKKSRKRAQPPAAPDPAPAPGGPSTVGAHQP